MSLEQYIENFGQAYADSLITLGQSMVDTLQHAGVNRVYGVGGDFAANIISAFEGSLGLSPCANEQHAAYTACGLAELNGVGVYLTTYTVGSLPCASALALAKAERLPVIAISGAPGESEIQGAALHHSVVSSSAWQKNFDLALDAFRAMGIRAERLQGERDPRQPHVAGSQFFQLVQYALKKKEPVFIEVPRDLVSSLTQPMNLPESKVSKLILEGADLIVQQIQQKLSQAKQPMIYLGENAKINPRLLQLVEKFAEQNQIPYATNWFAKGTLNELSPLSLGTYNGAFSSPQTRHFVEQSVDYILEVATSIHPQDTSIAFETGTHKILSFENKTVLKGTESGEVDLLSVFEQLVSKPVKSFSAPEFAETDNPLNLDATLGFHNVAQTLNLAQQQTNRTFVYLPEVGNSFFASFDLVTGPAQIGRSWITNPWYAAMGTSLCYAKATCHQVKDQQSSDLPIVLTGDGGFHFQSSELIHFLREQLSVVILYMRNDIFHLGKSSDAEIYQCSTKDFDVIKLVEGYGGQGRRCTTPEQLLAGLKEVAGLANPGLHLFEIPASTDLQQQPETIRLLNTYIKAKNGHPEAQAEWEKIEHLD